MHLYKSFLVVGFMCVAFINADFPDDPKPCKYGDSECIIKTAQYYLKEKSGGDPSINLVSFEPLEYPKIALKQSADSPVGINVIFNNIKLYGLKDGKITKVSGFGKDLTQEHEVQMKCPTLTQVSDYKIDGKVLLLPIKGQGFSNLTMFEPTAIVKFKGVPEMKNGATYMKIDKMDITLKPKSMFFNFENLFNGDKALGDSMNQFLSENWKEIFDELRPTFSEAYGNIIKFVLNNVFSKFPYDKFFTE